RSSRGPADRPRASRGAAAGGISRRARAAPRGRFDPNRERPASREGARHLEKPACSREAGLAPPPRLPRHGSRGRRTRMNTEDEELTPGERDSLAALRQDPAPSDSLERSVLRALAARGLVRARRTATRRW